MNTALDIPVLSPATASEQAARDRGFPASPRPVRVLHLLGGREGGGITTAIASLLKTLEGDAVAPSVIILRDRPAAGDEMLAPFRPQYVPKTRGKLGSAWRVARFCRRQQIDILHTHSISSNFYGRLAGLLSRGTPVVTTVHARTSDELRGTFGNSWLEGALARLDLQMSRISAHLIAVSDWLRDDLISRGVPADKVRAVSHGIEPRQTRVDPQEVDRLRAHLAIPAGDHIVGIVGRLTAVKNHSLFLQAARQLIDERPETTVVIVGDGPLLEDLERQSSDLGIVGRTRFVGWVDDPLPYLRLMDVLISASDSEGFGYSVLEAMACGTPVVATSVSEMPRIVQHETTGLLTPPGDAPALAAAVLRLLDAPELCSAMGAAARQQVAASFTLSGEAVAHLDVYARVLEVRRGDS